jgi:hypothetical protein
MALTLANAITQVRGILNEETAAFWTDAEITYWLQEGTRELATKALVVEADDDIDPLVANQLQYTASDETWIANCLEPYALIYNDGSYGYRSLIKITPHNLGHVATFTSGPPKYYCFFNRTFYLWPVASSNEAGVATITALYAKETDDITELNDEYQQLPILWAAARVKQKDQKGAEANGFFSMFYNSAAFERRDKVIREQDGVTDFAIPGRSKNA